MMLGEASSLSAAAIAIGIGASFAVTRFVKSMLFGITPTDARTYAGVFALLAAASLVACYLPAHRAARIDPMQALRDE